jgi:hypothetical protein
VKKNEKKFGRREKVNLQNPYPEIEKLNYSQSERVDLQLTKLEL